MVDAVAALPASHALARRKSVTAQEISAQTFVGLGPESALQERVARLFKEAGRSAAPEFITTSLLAACRMVCEGLGCAIVDPFSARAASSPQMVIRPLQPRLRIEYAAMWDKDTPTSGPISELILTIRRTAEEVLDRRP